MKRFLSFLLALVVVGGIALQIPLTAMAYDAAKPLPALSGNVGEDVAAVATSQLGYAYNGGTVYGAWWKSEIGSSTNFTTLAWCGMFACWCAKQAGAGLGVAYNSSGARASQLFEWQKKNGSYCTTFCCDPQPGDFMYFASSDMIPDHVAIVTSYDKATQTVYMVGGNQGTGDGQVTTTVCPWYPGAKRGSKYVIGYCRPKYPAASDVTPGKPTLKVPAENTDKEPVKFTWAATSNTTHYNLWIEIKGGSGSWTDHSSMEGVQSGVTKTLPTGTYRARLQSCNANAKTEDGTGIRSNLSDYVQFTVGCGHTYVANRTEPTCVKDGSCTYTCKDCGYSYTETLPATNQHTYDGGVQIGETDTAPAMGKYTCQVCGYVEERAAGVQSGTCGEKVSWTLGADGRLIIYGTGPMEDYQLVNTTESSSPFYDLSGVTSVVFKKGVTHVGDYAFFRQTMGSVSFSHTVRSIGSTAFCGCGELTAVTFPDSLVSIGSYAFNGCDSLAAVTIPDSVKTVGHCAFIRCHSLQEVTLGAGLTTIDEYTFSGCASLKKLTLPAEVNKILEGAFSGCISLSDVYYNGVEVQWNAIQIAEGNEPLAKAHLYIQGSAQGWVQVGDTWYYFNKGKMVTGWLEYGPVWYYFNADGTMLQGWLYYGKQWYYFNDIGRMHTGWAKDQGQWYYLDANGHMVTGWIELGGAWYYLKPSGNMAVGWQRVDNAWYYFKPSGVMQTGWLLYGKDWYYFEPGGAMVTGTKVIGGKTYNFSASGLCLNP